MRFATWNINSINRRLDLLLSWLEQTQPDVVLLQETKCSAADFPAMPLLAAGYESQVVGTGAWNGVALLSKTAVSDVAEHIYGAPSWEDQLEPRAIAADVGGTRFWGVYVPNGRTVDHPHYQYKLQWLDRLTQTLAKDLEQWDRVVVLGDFNVAPTDDDVYDTQAFVGSTHVTQAERDKLAAIGALGFVEIEPRPLKYDRAFTFWDYRQLAFPKNRGMRIDLVFASEPVSKAVVDAYVDREARKGKGTSDHAPVVVDVKE